MSELLADLEEFMAHVAEEREKYLHNILACSGAELFQYIAGARVFDSVHSDLTAIITKHEGKE